MTDLDTSERPFSQWRAQLGRVVSWFLVLGLAVVALWSLRDFSPVTTCEDVRQDRLDRAVEPLDSSHTVGQTFVARENGLAAVDVLLVVYGEGDAPVAPAGQLTFHLRKNTSATTDLATVTVETAGLTHNSSYRFSFPPQRESCGRAYAFLLEGTPSSRVSVWSNSVDAYADGVMLAAGQPTAGDLYFLTYCQSDPLLVLEDIGPALLRDGWLVVPFLLLFVLPGAILVSLLPGPGRTGGPAAPEDPLSQLALAVGLSLAAWPVGLFWLTAVGGRLDALSAWLVVGGLAALALALGVRHRFRGLRAWAAPQHRRPALALLAVLAATTLVRFLQVRGLVLPLWVDSVHHDVITRLILQYGGIPQSFRPFLPVDTFTSYHCGFHVDAALFAWLTGRPVEDVLLTLGQMLSVAASLAAYLLAARLTGRRLAGIIAALVVGLIASMPAYYVSWGRYTQLAGLVILPTALSLLLDAVEGREYRWRHVFLAALALAGLLLVHVRVTLFYGTFALPALVVLSLRGRRSWREALRPWWIVGLVGLGAALAALPWLVTFVPRLLPVDTLPARLQGTPAYNDFPWGYVTTGYNRELLTLAGGGILWGLWRRQRGVLLIASWVGLTLLVANPGLAGLPSLWPVNNSAVVISFFLPAAALAGFLVADLAGMLQPLLGRWGRVAVPGVAALGLATAGLWGARAMLPIVNPVTVLATADDVIACEWIHEHTPPTRSVLWTARFLVNTRFWQGNTYMGTDGGYWLPVLTGRWGSVPPAVYTLGDPDYIQAVNELAQWASAVESFDDPAVRERLRREGITHIYIGARGGPITPQKLLGVAGYRLVYQHGPVWIFAVEPSFPLTADRRRDTMPRAMLDFHESSAW